MDRATNAQHLPEGGVTRAHTRRYSSALRSKQQDLAKEVILRATADAVAEDPLLGFSLQDVARRAGVSLRSLYRHFPSRRQLFEALYDWGSGKAGVAEILEPLQSLDELPGIAHDLFSRFASDRPVVRAGVIASLSMDARPQRRKEWDDAVARLFEEALSELDDAEARQAFALVRLLFTGRVWLSLTERFGLDTQTAAEAIEWASATLIADLRAKAQRRAEAPDTRQR